MSGRRDGNEGGADARKARNEGRKKKSDAANRTPRHTPPNAGSYDIGAQARAVPSRKHLAGLRFTSTAWRSRVSRW
jgi:hypothetical protein